MMSIAAAAKAIFTSRFRFCRWNQLKIKKLNFEDNLSIKKDLKTLNETSLRTYHAHSVRFDVLDTENHYHQNEDEFIEANMNEIEMILELS
jgi:hypothetical protein